MLIGLDAIVTRDIRSKQFEQVFSTGIVSKKLHPLLLKGKTKKDSVESYFINFVKLTKSFIACRY